MKFCKRNFLSHFLFRLFISFSLAFPSLIMIYLGMASFGFTLFRVFLAFLIFGLYLLPRWKVFF